MTLRARINAIIVLTMALILHLGALAVIGNARDSVKEEIYASAHLALQLIEAGYVRSDFVTRQPLFAALEKTRHLHIQIIDSAGSAIDISRGYAAAKRKSVPDWFIWAVEPEALTIKRDIFDNRGRKLQAVISAEPQDEISEVWDESKRFLLLFCIFALSVFVSVNLILHRAFKAIAVILGGLENIERGEYKNRLPDFTTPEFSRIAQAVNHTAAALDTMQRQNAALALHSLEIQEAERQHLAQELHDELGQSLTAIKVMAVANKQAPYLSPLVGDQYPQHMEAIAGQGRQRDSGADDAIIGICDRLFTVIRAMMQRLHPLVLTELGLKASLENLADNWRACYPSIAIDLQCDSGIDALDKTNSIHMFRIAQECLTNIVKHSGATQVRVDVQPDGQNRMMLCIRDNGKGCDLTARHCGFGLLGIRERVNSLNGRLELLSTPGAGMIVKAALPITAPA
jgi:two-component system sensor histidine kinase UhpB